MRYRVAKNRRKHRTHRPEKPKAPNEKPKAPKAPVEPMIFCKPSGRIIAESEYVAIYQRELAERDAYWQQHAGPYHPRLGR